MLRDRGHEVIAVVRNPDKAANLKSIGVTVVQGDVTDKASMRAPMQGCDGVSMRVQAGVTYLGDNSKAKRELGYNPRPLEEGLRKTFLYEEAQLQKR